MKHTQELLLVLADIFPVALAMSKDSSNALCWYHSMYGDQVKNVLSYLVVKWIGWILVATSVVGQNCSSCLFYVYDQNS